MTAAGDGVRLTHSRLSVSLSGLSALTVDWRLTVARTRICTAVGSARPAGAIVIQHGGGRYGLGLGVRN